MNINTHDEEAGELAKFFLEKLIPDYNDQLRVDILFNEMDQSSCGIVYMLDDNHFEITINSKMNRLGVFMYLAHECTHIVQGIKDPDIFNMSHETLDDYYDDQYEQEAIINERRLLALAIHELTIDKRWWFFDPYFS